MAAGRALRTRNLILFGIMGLIGALVGGCAAFKVQAAENPAITYCQDQGGTIDQREFDGYTYYECIFNDGSECGAWAYYKGSCFPANAQEERPTPNPSSPAEVYCYELGYVITTRPIERYNGDFEVCVLPNGDSCPIEDFLGGRCGEEYTYCEQNGGTIGPSTAYYSNDGVCHLPSGENCHEFEYFSGTCGGDQ